MIDRLSHSMQVLQRLMKAQEFTANNMANLNTPGFKADKLFYHSFREMVNGEEVTRVVPRQTINMEQGHLESTGNPYDLAIEGDGFFRIDADGEEVLSRDGRFHLDPDGYLVNERGHSVLGTNGPVHIPVMEEAGTTDGADLLEISQDGSVIVNGALHDRITLAAVDGVENLERHSEGYLRAPAGLTVREDESSSIQQGFYEAGNVSPLQELSRMMTQSALFESQQRVMTTTDELLSRATNSLGRF